LIFKVSVRTINLTFLPIHDQSTSFLMPNDTRFTCETVAVATARLDPLAVALAAQLARSLGIRSLATPAPEMPIPERSCWPVVEVFSRTVPYGGAAVPVRIYKPGGNAILPSLVYLHGGGFFSGDLDSVDSNCRELSARVGCVVVSVDYCLAPANKFPAALNEVVAVARWVRDYGSEIGCNGAPMAIGGESAGANLAAAACLIARENGEPSFALQVLIYPMLDPTTEPELAAEHQDPIMSTGFLRSMWRNYTSSETEWANPLVSPCRAESLAGLPPAIVITAGTDPLHAEGAAFAAALNAAGVTVQYRHYPGLFHGFFGLPHPCAEVAMSDVVASLQGALHAN
jgi:acetyl esterase